MLDSANKLDIRTAALGMRGHIMNSVDLNQIRSIS